MQVLAKENIKLNQTVSSKEEAIKLAGQTLIDNGYVTEDYIGKMFEREETSSTFMGISLQFLTAQKKRNVRCFTLESQSYKFQMVSSTVKATRQKWYSALLGKIMSI